MRKNKYTWIVVVALALLIIIRLIGYFRQDQFTTDEKLTDGFNRNEKIILTKHAKCRMECREITYDEIKDVVANGQINERKSDLDSHVPKYAVEGYSEDKQHIRLIVADEKQGLVIVSCIDLEKEWPCNCR